MGTSEPDAKQVEGALLHGRWCGRLVSVRDALGNSTGFFYDGSGNLTEILSPLARVGIGLDRSGRIVSTELPQEVTRQVTYDARGRLSSQLYRAGDGSELYSEQLDRDVLGRIVSKREDGDVTSFSYDPLERLIRADYPDGFFSRSPAGTEGALKRTREQGPTSPSASPSGATPN